MFKSLKRKRWAHNVSFNEFSTRWLPKHYGSCPTPSPLYDDPFVSLKMKDDLHRELGVDCSSGGLWEIRDTMWAGGYMAERGAFVHLGIDYTVDAGTPISFDRHCEVVHIDTDYKNGRGDKGGWGRRVIVKLRDEPVYLLYAHLSPRVSCKLFETYAPGFVFGTIGDSRVNGGWSPHAHLQAIAEAAWEEKYEGNLESLDGYGRVEDLPWLKQDFLDPSPYVTVP